MITLSAPAKINWFLRVLRRREDGYHDIVSLIQCVTLADSLTMEYSDDLEVLVDADIPLETNLVYKAALLLREQTGIKSGARITIRKEIPMAAGLGGGSSDAAFALMGLNRLWGLGMRDEDLSRFGKILGSDVPFFFRGSAAVVEGRGEIVSPVGLAKSHVLLLVKPPAGVSSAWAYGELDRAGMVSTPPTPSAGLTKDGNNIKLFCHALERGDYSFLAAVQGNDLEPFVFKRYPILGAIKHTMMMRGALFSAMSGSGPTVFGVFESEVKARAALADMGPNWCRIVKTVTSDT